MIYRNAEMLRMTRLTEHLATTMAVDEVSLEIPQGQIVGVIGPSGAGRSAAPEPPGAIARRSCASPCCSKSFLSCQVIPGTTANRIHIPQPLSTSWAPAVLAYTW